MKLSNEEGIIGVKISVQGQNSGKSMKETINMINVNN
jgi:hypothetical protein